MIIGHILAGDLENLFASDRRDLLEFWNSIDQGLHRHSGCLVSHARGAGRSAPGDRAARGDNHDIWEGLGYRMDRQDRRVADQEEQQERSKSDVHR
jgi:hypothetical protein